MRALYASQSGCPPQRSSALFSSSGTLLTRVSSRKTNTGESSVTHCQPRRARQRHDGDADPEQDLAEVVGVARPGPQAGADEAPLVGRIGAEGPLLGIGGDSSANPRAHSTSPMAVTVPSSTRVLEVMAASAADAVIVTHSPCSVQVFRKRGQDG